MLPRTVLESQQFEPAAVPARPAADCWKLAAGKALSLHPRAFGLLEITQGRVWLTMSGVLADWPGAPADIVLGAGEQLAIAPGQHVVMEPWEPDAPGAEVSFRWDCVAAALAQPSRPSQRSVAARDWESGVVQPLCDLVQAFVQGGRAVADGARAGGRVATGLVRFALGRTTAPLQRRTA